MVLFCVDDCILYAKDSTSINIRISDLKDEFLLGREEDMVRFLGLKISREDGTITLSQTDLIDKILEATQMEDCNIKFTPADKVPLDNDLDGDQCCNE